MKRHKEVIVVFDSGIGGLSYLQYIKERLPNNNYVYIADNKNFPYGEKTPEFLLKEILALISKIRLKYKIVAFVFACNTASIGLYNVLNLDFPIIYTLPEIGLVNDLPLKKIMLIGTKATISSSFIENQKNMYKNLEVSVASELVKFVEFGNKYKIESFHYLQNLKLEMIKNNKDAIYLACTHYLHIKKFIETILKVPVYENREIILSKLQGIIKENSSEKKYLKEFYLTKRNNLVFYKKIYNKYGLKFKGIIS